MSDMMTFPETWEEYEKQYGFADDEEVYTNGSRLIPSFRVKQWLDHIPSAEKAQLPEEDATSVCKCPCEYREPCDVCHYDACRGHGCPAEEGLKDERHD